MLQRETDNKAARVSSFLSPLSVTQPASITEAAVHLQQGRDIGSESLVYLAATSQVAGEEAEEVLCEGLPATAITSGLIKSFHVFNSLSNTNFS